MKKGNDPSGEFTLLIVLVAIVFIFLVFDWWFAWRIPGASR